MRIFTLVDGLNSTSSPIPSAKFEKIDYSFIGVKRYIKSESAISRYMKRCALQGGIDGNGMNMKMFRKTWESWLIASYPDRKEEVFLSQGHTSLTALQHYVNLPFTEEDKLKMREWTEGWR